MSPTAATAVPDALGLERTRLEDAEAGIGRLVALGLGGAERIGDEGQLPADGLGAIRGNRNLPLQIRRVPAPSCTVDKSSFSSSPSASGWKVRFLR